jgi:hypothetical protein
MFIALKETSAWPSGDEMKKCDEILERIVQLTATMVELADLGDEAREDVGCGVLYGLLRDSAFKIRKVAEQEKEDHMRKPSRCRPTGRDKPSERDAFGAGRDTPPSDAPGHFKR